MCQQKIYDVSDDWAQCATRDLFYQDVITTSPNARRPAHVVPSTSVFETASVSETCAASETAVVYSTEDELSKDETQTETGPVLTSSNARRPAHIVPSSSVCETASVSERCAASETAVVYSTTQLLLFYEDVITTSVSV